MSRSALHIVLLLVLFICVRGSFGSGSGVGEPKIRCREAERQALLRIKQDFFVDPYGRGADPNVLLSSWGGEEEKRECCEWIGIQCSNNSGRVIRLDLSPSTFHWDGSSSPSPLFGNMSSSLVDLKHLSHLDLSLIDFSYFSSFPGSIGSLTKLRYLNLSGTSLGIEISPLLLGNLSSLQVLDLSWNSVPRSIFQWLFNHNRSIVHVDLSHCSNLGGPFPNGFNNMVALQYLDLSTAGFQGIIPESFGNLISLKYLDLGRRSRSYYFGHIDGFHPKSFRNMTALTYLDLSWNKLRGSIPESFGDMVALRYLDLDENHLDSLNPKSFVSMTAIQYLSIYSNNLKGPIPKHFGNMSSLGYLDLSSNMLEGEIPKSIWKICTLRDFIAPGNSLSGEIQFAQLNSSMSCANFSLEYLDLNQNKIRGPLPDFTLYPSLIELHLSSNKFTGISNSIGQLSKLEIMDFSKNSIQSVISEAHFAKLFNLKFLDFSENSIQGVISEAHFAKLFNLTYLDLSANSNLALKITSDWIPPFQLEFIYLGSCKLGPLFPNWLQTQKDHYHKLNISNSGIADSIPDWLWDFNPNISLLDLSNNGIRGISPDVKKRSRFSRKPYATPDIDLSSNQLQGIVPRFLFEVTSSLSLFNNSFSQLDSLCNITEASPLIFLDVSYNQLSGELPDCWFQAKILRILVLANNNLSGKIPVSIGFLHKINILHLGNNSLTAELPSSLMNCTKLVVFDVGKNKLSGPIPTWIGTSLTELIIISLWSNHFNGSIPSQLCHLVNLQVLDLSSNNLSQEIPKCLGNLIAMKQIESGDPEGYYEKKGPSVPHDFVRERLVLVWKGAISEFKNTGLLNNIDLSSNKLTGEIPRDVTTLVQLNSFNLSRNSLSGYIPQEIGRLKSLDVLDLSNNYLFGQIPSSLSQVDRLAALDLSYNNLSGKIPVGTQLQTRDASAFLGNPQLCGDPLPKKCPNEEHPSISNGITEDGYRDELITKGFYISLAIGFVVGFWGLCGTLIFNKSLRYAYLKLLNNMGDWIQVTKEVHKRKLLRLIQS